MTSKSTPDLVIRDARVDELDDISLLLKAAYQQYRKSIPAPAWQSYLEDIMDVRSREPEAQLIVAEWKGHLAGSVTLYLELPASWKSDHYWPKGWAVARLLGVHPRYRGRGIGRALMEECTRRCRKSGIKTLGLHTTEIMAVARGMYERMGFNRVPRYDFKPTLHVVVMAYRLNL